MNKKETDRSIIKKTIFLAIFLVSQELYVMHLFTNGLLAHYGYTILSINLVAQIAILAIFISMIAVCFTIIIHGLYKNKKYVKKFTGVYLLWASFFPLWSIIVNSHISLNILAISVNVLIILYLFKIPIKNIHIKTSNEIFIKLKSHYKDIISSINKHLTKKHS